MNEKRQNNMTVNKFQFEQPSTLIRLYMGVMDYNMYMDTKDELDPFQLRDSIIEISSEI